MGGLEGDQGCGEDEIQEGKGGERRRPLHSKRQTFDNRVFSRMRHKPQLIQLSRTAFVLMLTWSVFQIGCGGRRPLGRSSLYKMGERAQVGNLTYNVIDADWKTQLGEGANAKVPQNRYL